MSDAVIGIAGSQKKQQSDATSARNTSKTWHKKAKVAGGIAAVMLCVLTWWKNLPDETSKVANTTKGSTVVAAPQVPSSAREYFGQPVVLPPTGETWSSWIRVTGDRCIWIFDVSPEQVQAKEKETDEGTGWTAYQSKRQRGEVGNFGWVRIKSNTPVKYEFRPRGMCS